MEALRKRIYTLKEYIELEKKMGQKYEYHSGQIYSLAGGTIEHGLICGNIYSEIKNELANKESECYPLNSEVRLHLDKTESYVYPDTMVICGEMEKANDNNLAVKNPILIVEVLSKTTADYDRGDKFHMYRKIPTFREYVIIEQERYIVDVQYRKHKDALWMINRYEGIDSEIELKSIGISLTMEKLYERVQIKD